MTQTSDEDLYCRLKDLSRALPRWLETDRQALLDGLIAQLLADYRALPSPEPVEGIETGLDFLGLLLTEGGDNGLYEATMAQLDSDLYQAVADLYADDQIALLLPLEADDLEDLFRDRDIEQWPRFLLAGGQWPETMRHIVLSQIEPKERRQS